MSNFSRLLGLAQKALDGVGSSKPDARGGTHASAPDDRAAIARYDYLLQSADPHQIEQVHREAFARLTPAQRAQVDERMRAELPPHEQPRSSRPDDLARAATRTEMGRPGMLRGLLSRAGGRGAPGSSALGGGVMGGAVAGAGLAAGGMLAAVAGGAVVSSVAGPLLEQAATLGVDFDALAGAVDVEGLAGDAVSGAGDQISGLGDRVSELGSGFSLPGLDDLFGR